MYKKNILLEFSVISSALLLSLSVGQKPSFADYDQDLLSTYMTNYADAQRCVENLNSGCPVSGEVLIQFYTSKIQELIRQTDEAAIQDPSENNCSKALGYHQRISGTDYDMKLSYTFINNYCTQNANQ